MGQIEQGPFLARFAAWVAVIVLILLFFAPALVLAYHAGEAYGPIARYMIGCGGLCLTAAFLVFLQGLPTDER
jgi:hypothetical protein